MMKMRSMMNTNVIPVKIKYALQMPRLEELPGHVSWYRYVGLRTGYTFRSVSDRLSKSGNQETWRRPWVNTSAKSLLGSDHVERQSR